MSTYTQLGIDLVPEFVTGLSWKAQLAERIYSETGDKALKSMWGEHDWNVKLIDKLVQLSSKKLLPGADLTLSMKANSGVSLATAQSFLKHVDEYRNKESTVSAISTTGKVIKQIAEAVGNVAEGGGKGVKALPFAITVLAIGAGVYLLFAGKRGVNLFPSINIK